MYSVVDPVSLSLPILSLYMSGTRKKVDIDYAVLHSTGRRVPIVREREGVQTMATSPDLATQAVNITSDFEDFLESFKIEDIDDEDELAEYVSKIGNIKKVFRRIYAQLKLSEGEGFGTKFPNYERELKEINETFQEGNKKLTGLRKAAKEKIDAGDKLRNVLETEKLRQEMIALQNVAEEKRSQAIQDWKFSVEQVNWFIEQCTWDTYNEVDDVQPLLTSLESYLSKVCKACAELRGILGGDAEEYLVENEKVVSFVRGHIKLGTARLQTIRNDKILLQAALAEKEASHKRLAEEQRLQRENWEEKIKVQNLMTCAQSLEYEIKTRYDALKTKFKIDLSKLSDYEILDLKKREDSLSAELREILDKISSLLQYVVPCGDTANYIRANVKIMRDDISLETEDFLKSVRNTIADRDISEKKLKNSVGLNIQLPKFKGYQSELNIFTFRSEFKKLIEPNIQKSLWADYLKKNCLAGPAHNLVSGMEDIDVIWTKLTEVYGNTQLLLQNKIGSLGKFSNLDRLHDDEKVAYTLSSILNTMEDLRKLAEEYDLQSELYYGGGLQRILDLIGKQRERKFIKSTAKEQLKNDQKWVKLVDFLKGELQEREAYILNDKSKKCLNPDSKPPKGKDPDPDKRKSDPKQDHDTGSKNFHGNDGPGQKPEKCSCHICGKDDDHVLSMDSNKKPVIEYVSCKVFVDKTCAERDKLLFKKRFCNKCLTPGVKYGSNHDCDQQYLCGQKFLRKRDNTEQLCQKHVLVCGHHHEEESNKKLLEKYKKNVILAHGKFFDFTKNVSIACFSEAYRSDSGTDDEDTGVFAFQTIDVAPGVTGNGFYDSGCGKCLGTKTFVDKLLSIGRAELVRPGPIILEGVNNQTSVCDYGEYRIRLPLKNGGEAKMVCLCVDDITIPFPKYPLKIVEEDIRKNLEETNQDVLDVLPQLPDEVGGHVDVMIGVAYLKYTPREIARLETGLTIYDSMFKSPDGTTGVVAGPHPEFVKTERLAHFTSDRKVSYYTEPVKRYLDFIASQVSAPLLGKQRIFVDSDLVPLFPKETCTDDELLSTDSHEVVPLSGKGTGECEIGDLVAGGRGSDFCALKNPAFSYRCMSCRNCTECKAFIARAPKNLKDFEKIEESGTNISYRCVRCRNCKDCKKGALVEEISLREEYEQSVIDQSVTLDTEKNVCTALLPFLENPDLKLVCNLSSARKVFNGVVKRLAKNVDDREAVLEAIRKLQRLGFVDWVENLPEEDQKLIFEFLVRYYIPWRVVWSDSLSTPVRPVFDASMRSGSGISLNDILAKGTNNMNSLVEMIIRWLCKLYAYHTDISKCYNGVKLDKSHWRFQLFLFEKDLDPNKEPKPMAVKTCIYGVRSSGNQAERALRLTADTYAEEFPLAHDIIYNDLYVDDCLSGEATDEGRDDAMDQLRQCLEKGGFALKGFTLSGHDPDPSLSLDGKSISTTGMKWFSRDDELMLNAGEAIFTRKVRGRRVSFKSDHLTVTDCASIVAQLFDPIGLVAPLVGNFKVDVSYLHRSGLTWGDEIPENLSSVWSSNEEMIKEIGTLRYKRAIVPPDAKNLDIVTIDTGDASSILICVAIYVRFEKRDGSFSCQLVFARTKVLPEGTTTPRGEMMAAVMNAATGYTVKKALGDHHKKAFKLTDSTVALHWICSEDIVLKTWVRTRSIECNRLSSSWYHVESKDMIADLGTRKGVRVKDVADGSEWIKGFPWMSGPEEEFPIRTLEQVQLTQQELNEVRKETMVTKTFYVGPFHVRRSAVMERETDEQIKLRYDFSDYVIDPNRFRFRKVVRILALALSFVWKISKNVLRVRENIIFKHTPPGGIPEILKPTDDRYLVTTSLVSNMGPSGCPGGKVVEVTDQMLQASMTYFSIKVTNEIKHFLGQKKYVNISKEVDGILYYSGRILEDHQFDGYPDLCSAAIDLSSTTFCVPLMDQFSPVGIAVALEIHWHHPDVRHKGIDTILRQMLRVAHIIGGRQLAVSIKQGCRRCRFLYKKSLDVAMGPIQNVNLCIAPPFYACQIDIFGPFKTYSCANKRATLKVWFSIFCCTTTGAIDIRVMEDYSTDSVVLSFVRFSCRYGYPRYLMPDAGSQLLKSCEDMRYSFTDMKQRLSFEYDVDYSPCPVGSHYVHGKVERKIREVKKSVDISIQNERLSHIQWETLMHQISNSINNLPIGLKSSSRELENLDLITPNRLILGRNNDRSPNAPLTICNDHKRLLESNATIFRAWFKSWLTSYVPNLIERPKWHHTDGEVSIGDIVLFLKSEREYDEQYQYGQISALHRGRDGVVRKVDVTYKNSNENISRITRRGVRELVIISPIDELDIYERLDHMT